MPTFKCCACGEINSLYNLHNCTRCGADQDHHLDTTHVCTHTPKSQENPELRRLRNRVSELEYQLLKKSRP